MLTARLRRTPWVIWLQDILPDGAASTGYVERSGSIYGASRKLEDAAYRSAAHIVVLSESFRENLVSKGVPGSKVSLAYNPATFPAESIYLKSRTAGEPPRILCMGNIGKSQNIPAIIQAFESNERLSAINARLVIAGSGVAAAEARAAVTTDRVEMPGLLLGQDLVNELAGAHLGLVSQSYEGGEFNVPSKLMNYLAVGLPVVASVAPEGEVAAILSKSGAGWMTDRVAPERFAEVAADAISDPEELLRRSHAAVKFARANLMPSSLAANFEGVLTEMTRAGGSAEDTHAEVLRSVSGEMSATAAGRLRSDQPSPGLALVGVTLPVLMRLRKDTVGAGPAVPTVCHPSLNL